MVTRVTKLTQLAQFAQILNLQPGLVHRGRHDPSADAIYVENIVQREGDGGRQDDDLRERVGHGRSHEEDEERGVHAAEEAVPEHELREGVDCPR